MQTLNVREYVTSLFLIRNYYDRDILLLYYLKHKILSLMVVTFCLYTYVRLIITSYDEVNYGSWGLESLPEFKHRAFEAPTYVLNLDKTVIFGPNGPDSSHLAWLLILGD